MNRGIVYVAYGDNAIREATESIKSLKQYNNLPIAVISDRTIKGTEPIIFREAGPGARWAKLMIDIFSPYDYTLYLDADTRIKGDLSAGFDILQDDWDLAIAPSGRQNADVLGNLDEKDRQYTFETLGTTHPLSLQAGVFFFKKNEQVLRFFDKWRVEWGKFFNQDQGAMLRALQQVPLRVWLLSNDWNGGEMIEHRFGKAR